MKPVYVRISHRTGAKLPLLREERLDVLAANMRERNSETFRRRAAALASWARRKVPKVPKGES